VNVRVCFFNNLGVPWLLFKVTFCRCIFFSFCASKSKIGLNRSFIFPLLQFKVHVGFLGNRYTVEWMELSTVPACEGTYVSAHPHTRRVARRPPASAPAASPYDGHRFIVRFPLPCSAISPKQPEACATPRSIARSSTRVRCVPWRPCRRAARSTQGPRRKGRRTSSPHQGGTSRSTRPPRQVAS
jgi:hypothetical protein